MFGVSFGEAVFLVIIAIVVIGPRDLPTMMRKLGQTISKLRRAATDLRSQSGIDEILHNEGIQREVHELQKLATGRILELGLDEPLLPAFSPLVPRTPASEPQGDDPYQIRRSPPRNREYPAGGPDAFDALPEDAYPADSDDGPAAPVPSANPSPNPSPAPDASAPGSPAPGSPALAGAEAQATGVAGAVARGALPDDDEHQAA